MDGKRRKSAHRLLDKFFTEKSDFKKLIPHLSTPQISDSLKQVTGNQGTISGVKSLNGQKLFGNILTLSTKDDDWGTSVRGIDHALPGEVIFIFSEGENNAVWGELTSKAAKNKGIAGTIIFGACRDLDSIKNIKYPVFARKVIPHAGRPRNEGKINIKLDCQGTMVHPGDYLFGDECGVVVVPRENFIEVMEVAEEIKKRENVIVKQIEEGKPLSEILNI
ncbi:MAG: RraA family protein [Euryarchaeota archaeon]